MKGNNKKRQGLQNSKRQARLLFIRTQKKLPQWRAEKVDLRDGLAALARQVVMNMQAVGIARNVQEHHQNGHKFLLFERKSTLRRKS